MLIDSHCHLDRLDLSRYPGGLHQALDEARAHQVGRFLCISISLEAYPAMRELIEPEPDVSVSVGVHPTDKVPQEPTVEAILAFTDDPRVVAIGETGLDYYYVKEAAEQELQRRRFATHIEAARACNKPLIVHTRDAREDTLALLREGHAEEPGGILHCFTETWDMARAALDLGFYISFSGIVTFRNAEALREVARKVPSDRILIETDSPYLAPVPRRGKPNEPAYVRYVAESLAETRGEPVEELINASTENFFRLFPSTREEYRVSA